MSKEGAGIPDKPQSLPLRCSSSNPDRRLCCRVSSLPSWSPEVASCTSKVSGVCFALECPSCYRILRTDVDPLHGVRPVASALSCLPKDLEGIYWFLPKAWTRDLGFARERAGEARAARPFTSELVVSGSARSSTGPAQIGAGEGRCAARWARTGEGAVQREVCVVWRAAQGEGDPGRLRAFPEPASVEGGGRQARGVGAGGLGRPRRRPPSTPLREELPPPRPARTRSGSTRGGTRGRRRKRRRPGGRAEAGPRRPLPLAFTRRGPPRWLDGPGFGVVSGRRHFPARPRPTHRGVDGDGD